jgi:putative acetyltransferase
VAENDAAAGGIAIELVTAPTDEARELIGHLDRALAADYLPEQQHGLAFEAIFRPHVRFFLARLDGDAVGCGGVALFATFAEVKRMFVRAGVRGRGVARALLARLEAEALANGHAWMRLETGTRQPAAIRLYERAGYRRCAAFGDYAMMGPDAIATSLFYEKRLRAGAH